MGCTQNSTFIFILLTIQKARNYKRLFNQGQNRIVSVPLFVLLYSPLYLVVHLNLLTCLSLTICILVCLHSVCFGLSDPIVFKWGEHLKQFEIVVYSVCLDNQEKTWWLTLVQPNKHTWSSVPESKTDILDPALISHFLSTRVLLRSFTVEH